MEKSLIESYSNAAQTSLSAAVISAVATTIDVADPSLFPSYGQFRIKIDDEIMLVTGGQGTTTWTVVRGKEGTTADTHLNGVPVDYTLTKESLERVATNPIGSDDVAGQGMFLMSCHQSIDQKPYLMASDDGKNWNLLNMEPAIPSGHRDPSILQFGGKYWIANTNQLLTSFSVYSSSDLKDWTLVANVSMTAIANLHLVWAPEWFVDDDGSVHIFCACSTNGVTTNFQIYRVNPTNDAMTSWSSPTAITITGENNVIDAYAIKKGGTYYLWYKEEDTDYIQYASSSTLNGPYTNVQTGNWAGWGNPIEAPCLVKIDASTWRIYLNQHSGFNSVAVYYSDSTDDWATWSAKTAIVAPWVVAHPTIIRVRDFGTMRNMFALYMQSMMPQGAHITKSVLQTVPSGFGTPITFASESRDDGNFFTTGANTRLTAKVTGWYSFGATVQFTPNATGKRVLDMRITRITNGSHIYLGTQDRTNLNATDIVTITTQSSYWLEAGDYVEAVVFQNSGVGNNVGPGRAWIVLHK